MNKLEMIICIALELATMGQEEYVRVKSQLLEQVDGRPELEKIVKAVIAVVEESR